MKIQNIAIYGTGGFGREVQMLIDQINGKNKKWNFIGFYDDYLEKGTLVNESPVLGTISDLNNLKSELNLVVAIGNPIIKKKVVNEIINPLIQFPLLIHPSVLIGSRKYVSIGEGSVICAGVIITVNIKIGQHVQLNLYSTIGHDTIIGDFSSLMPKVSTGGEVKVGNSVLIGIGAQVINGIDIGDRSTIGAGATVVKNIKSDYTYVENPGRAFKKF